MDFKSKIIESVMEADKELKQMVANYEATIKQQLQEIEELRKHESQQEEIMRQQIEIQELRKQLKLSEGENLLLQVRLDLIEAKKEKTKKVLSKKEQTSSEISQGIVSENHEESKWENTLIKVRNDLEAVNEKKKRERTYYGNIPSTSSSEDPFALLSNTSTPSIYRYKLNIIDSKILETCIRKYNLVERRAILPLYETKNSREIYLYTEAETIYIDLLLKEIYMVQEEFDKLQTRYAPLILKHRLLTKVQPSNKVKQTVNSAEIQWGSINVKPASSSAPIEDKVFSEQSELNKMGYRISGVTREERWEVLRRAIPALGLKKVVNIISANVRLRKRQKNGEQKYQHAIVEWEYDLSQLKKKYYYDGFKWPEA